MTDAELLEVLVAFVVGIVLGHLFVRAVLAARDRRTRVVRPRRPLFDGMAELTAAGRAAYAGDERVAGYVDEAEAEREQDEGPAQPERGIAVGEQVSVEPSLDAAGWIAQDRARLRGVHGP